MPIKIPHDGQINHNEFLSYPNKCDQVMLDKSKMPEYRTTSVGTTVYWGSAESARQLQESSHGL